MHGKYYLSPLQTQLDSKINHYHPFPTAPPLLPALSPDPPILPSPPRRLLFADSARFAVMPPDSCTEPRLPPKTKPKSAAAGTPHLPLIFQHPLVEVSIHPESMFLKAIYYILKIFYPAFAVHHLQKPQSSHYIKPLHHGSPSSSKVIQ